MIFIYYDIILLFAKTKKKILEFIKIITKVYQVTYGHVKHIKKNAKCVGIRTQYKNTKYVKDLGLRKYVFNLN